MKNLIFIIAIFCAPLATSFAQTNTWTGAVDSNWGNSNNWSMGVPTSSHDVIIPSGSNVILNVTASVQSITIQGGSTFVLSNSLSMTGASSFSVGTTVTWPGGHSLSGGTLTNYGTINLTNNFVKLYKV